MNPFKFYREKAGLTQYDVSGMLFVERSAISKWETGKQYPKVAMLKDIARAYGCTVDQLLDEDVEGDV